MRLDETLRLRLVTSQGSPYPSRSPTPASVLHAASAAGRGDSVHLPRRVRPCRRYLSPERLRKLLLNPSAR